ncbi:MAG: hypothetical protein FJ264_16570 [Planctomycetes bacterium]|nr:hypothetical protein [Planctomycetota bacterium]
MKSTRLTTMHKNNVSNVAQQKKKFDMQSYMGAVNRQKLDGEKRYKLKTSKHSGVISTSDKEFVHTGKIDKHYSKILHKAFDVRQESDYKEFVKVSHKDAIEAVKFAPNYHL